MPSFIDRVPGLLREGLGGRDPEEGGDGDEQKAPHDRVRVASVPTIALMADARPIGVFDSGVGGLTVLHECLVTMPHEDFVYLGDHARLPYGPRPLDEVRRFAHEIGALPRARRA